MADTRALEARVRKDVRVQVPQGPPTISEEAKTDAGRELANRIEMLEQQLLALDSKDAADFQVIVYKLSSLLMRLALRYHLT